MMVILRYDGDIYDRNTNAGQRLRVAVKRIIDKLDAHGVDYTTDTTADDVNPPEVVFGSYVCCGLKGVIHNLVDIVACSKL